MSAKGRESTVASRWKADLHPDNLTAGGLRDFDAADRALRID